MWTRSVNISRAKAVRPTVAILPPARSLSTRTHSCVLVYNSFADIISGPATELAVIDRSCVRHDATEILRCDQDDGHAVNHYPFLRL